MDYCHEKKCFMAVETGFPSARKKGCFQGPVTDQQKQQVQSIMGNSLAAHGETQSLLYTN